LKLRCAACDARLTAREATRKGEHSGEYLDLCDVCVATIADQIGIVDSPINAERTEDEEQQLPGVIDDFRFDL
jgi:hypothetical protein